MDDQVLYTEEIKNVEDLTEEEISEGLVNTIEAIENQRLNNLGNVRTIITSMIDKDIDHYNSAAGAVDVMNYIIEENPSNNVTIQYGQALSSKVVLALNALKEKADNIEYDQIETLFNDIKNFSTLEIEDGYKTAYENVVNKICEEIQPFVDNIQEYNNHMMEKLSNYVNSLSSLGETNPQILNSVLNVEEDPYGTELL